MVDVRSARFQIVADGHYRSSNSFVDELLRRTESIQITKIQKNKKELTVLFPMPVGPITLETKLVTSR